MEAVVIDDVRFEPNTERLAKRLRVRPGSLQGEEFARGLVRYGVDDLTRVLGKSSPQVTAELHRPAQEVIHRDDLVLLI